MEYLTCPVTFVERYENNTRRFVLALPKPVDFHAGQYLQVVADDKRFPFSIANAPRRKRIVELHISPTPDSKDSDMVEALLNSSDQLNIEIPLGDCYVTEAPCRTLILIAASTGITQMKSIVEHLLESEIKHPIHLYWGVVAATDLYLIDICNNWSDNHDNFHFVPVVSEPRTTQEWQGRTGLVGEAVLEDFEDLKNVTIIVSGGPGMVYATLDAFMARGMPAENMKSDIFSYSPRH